MTINIKDKVTGKLITLIFIIQDNLSALYKKKRKMRSKVFIRLFVCLKILKSCHLKEVVCTRQMFLQLLKRCYCALNSPSDKFLSFCQFWRLILFLSSCHCVLFFFKLRGQTKRISYGIKRLQRLRLLGHTPCNRKLCLTCSYPTI